MDQEILHLIIFEIERMLEKKITDEQRKYLIDLFC
jgi:hypothetical protein